MRFKTKNSAGKTQTVMLPGSKNDLTVRQMLALLFDWDHKDIIKAFSILSGIDYDAVNNNQARGFEVQVVDGLSWLFKEPISYDDQPVPDELTIDNKKIQIQFDIGAFRLGQKIAISQAIRTNKDNLDKAIPEVLAFSMDMAFFESDLPERERKFDYDRAITLKEKILDMPACEAYPAAIFFLNSITSSATFGMYAYSLTPFSLILAVSKRAMIWPTRLILNSLATFFQLIRS